MADGPATKSSVIKLAEALQAHVQKFDRFEKMTEDISGKLSRIELERAEEKGRNAFAQFSRLEAENRAMEMRLRDLENSRAKLWGALAVVTFVGMPGVAAIVHYAK